MLKWHAAEASASASPLRELAGRCISRVAHDLEKQNRVLPRLCSGHAAHLHRSQNADPAATRRRQVSGAICFLAPRWRAAGVA